MIDTETPEEEPQLQHITADDIEFIGRAMRGVKSARVRYFDADKGFQDEFVALLLALDVSAKSENISRIAPAPHRRYSVQYASDSATITVSQHRPLLG